MEGEGISWPGRRVNNGLDIGDVETMWRGAVPMSIRWRMVSASQGGVALHRCLRAVSVAGWRSANPDGHEGAEAQVRPEGDR